MYSELQDNPYEEQKDDVALSLTGESNIYAAPLWDWLLHVVKGNEMLDCSRDNIMQNQLLAEVSMGMAFCSTYRAHVFIRIKGYISMLNEAQLCYICTKQIPVKLFNLLQTFSFADVMEMCIAIFYRF